MPVASTRCILCSALSRPARVQRFYSSTNLATVAKMGRSSLASSRARSRIISRPFSPAGSMFLADPHLLHSVTCLSVPHV